MSGCPGGRSANRRPFRLAAGSGLCEMEVKEKEAAATCEYKGKTYYFYAVGRKEKFAKDPEKFLKKTKE